MSAEIDVSLPRIDPVLLTPETVDLDRYYRLEDLAAMPVEVLEELWLACPDRPFYEGALRQAVEDSFGRDTVAGDLDRLSVIDECLAYYTGTHPNLPGSAPRIPAARKEDGTVAWFKVSDRIRERLEAGLPLEDPPASAEKEALKPRTLLLTGGLVLSGLCLLTIVLRSLLAGGDRGVAAAQLTETAAVALPSAPPAETATPTPLALEDIDRPIRAGEDLRGYYPVLLEILPGGGLSRVFPVQQKEIQIAEWLYEADPDVASAVLGLAVRPVLGLPYSPANAAFLEQMKPGDEIRLRMSTGAALRFTVSTVERVGRQEVSIFEQSRPGIVVLLLGDPGPDRLALSGTYLSSSEGPGLPDAAEGQAASPGESLPVGAGLNLALSSVRGSQGSQDAPLPPEWQYLLLDLEISAAGPSDTASLGLELADPLGGRYAPVRVEGGLLKHAPWGPTRIEAGETLRRTVAFLVPRSLTGPLLLVTGPGGERATFALPAWETGDPGDRLEVLILGLVSEGNPEQPGDLLVRVRLFNPHQAALTLGPGAVYAIFSPLDPGEGFPVGPQVQATGEDLPVTLAPGEALDLELRFPWNGEAFAGIGIGANRFSAQLR
jgi:hypothetical protein